MSNSIEKELHLPFLDRRLTNTASRLAWNSLVGNKHNEAKINFKTNWNIYTYCAYTNLSKTDMFENKSWSSGVLNFFIDFIKTLAPFLWRLITPSDIVQFIVILLKVWYWIAYYAQNFFHQKLNFNHFETVLKCNYILSSKWLHLEANSCVEIM